jgi:hypothetical protein
MVVSVLMVKKVCPAKMARADVKVIRAAPAQKVNKVNPAKMVAQLFTCRAQIPALLVLAHSGFARELKQRVKEIRWVTHS